MKTLALIATVMAAALLIAAASPRETVGKSRKDQHEESAKKVKELQKERIATLKEMAEALAKLFQHGNVTYGEVAEARTLLFKAELDAAEKESERITLYQKRVQALKEAEKLAEQRVKAAIGTRATVLKIKAMRLEAEIDLERAKAKAAKETR